MLNGLGGVGKTRLVVEYAWQHVDDYTALLFVVADSAEALQHNLAALCRPLVLEQQQEADESKQRDAVLAWLRQHPGWLLILDNADTEQAATAIEALVPHLLGGHLQSLPAWQTGAITCNHYRSIPCHPLLRQSFCWRVRKPGAAHCWTIPLKPAF